MVTPGGGAFVYFIQAGPGGPVKIGFTNNVKSRLESLQTGCPQRLVLLGSIPCEDGRAFEAELHARFAALRIERSEWFRWGPELAEDLAERFESAGGGHRRVARTVTRDWHQPLCSSCGEPILEPQHCLAGWFDHDDQNSCPFVCHTGDRCDFYELVGHLEGLQDLPIDTLRRAPMEAVMVALRRDKDDQASRTAWARWISIVLGLPFCGWPCTLDLRLRGEVADVLPDRVALAPEIEAALVKVRAHEGTGLL